MPRDPSDLLWPEEPAPFAVSHEHPATRRFVSKVMLSEVSDSRVLEAVEESLRQAIAGLLEAGNVTVPEWEHQTFSLLDLEQMVMNLSGHGYITSTSGLASLDVNGAKLESDVGPGECVRFPQSQACAYDQSEEQKKRLTIWHRQWSLTVRSPFAEDYSFDPRFLTGC